MLGRQCVQGFTLIELIVTLIIIVILTLVAIPLFTSLIQEHRVIGQAENLYYSLQYARSEAVKRNATIYVSFSTGSSWCYGLNVGSACNCTIANNCGLETVSAPAAQETSLSTSGLTNNAISFEGTHGAASSTGSITFTVYGGTSLITISIGTMGGLQMCSTGIGGYQAC